MMKNFNEQILNYIIIGVGSIGLISLLAVSVIYSNLVKSSENITITKNNLLKQVKLKYENCYKLGLVINDVQSFIGKHVYKVKVTGMYVHTWENISSQAIYICIILGLLGTFINIIRALEWSTTFLTGLLGFGVSALLLIIKSLMCIEVKKEIFNANVIDYLENFLRNKLEQHYEKEGSYGSNQEIQEMASKNISNVTLSKEIEADIEYLKQCIKDISNDKKGGQDANSINEKLIEEVLSQL